MKTFITKRERGFLCFFLPLFALKLLSFSAENFALKAVAVVCFVVFVMHFTSETYKKAHLRLFLFLLIYTAILIFTCGKQGAFFSVVTLIMMKGVDLNRRVYGILMKTGIVFVLGACYNGLNTTIVTERLVGEEWVSMVKRSNIIYVAYMAVACLYIIKNRANFSRKHFIILSVASFLMYIYVGSRTGLIIMMTLLLMIIILRKDFIRRRVLVRWMCVLSPLICMILSIITAWNYANSDSLFFLDKLMQGRLEQGYFYLHKYDVMLFGQPIEENFNGDSGDYQCLDSAYLDMLVCEGLIFTFLWIGSTMWVISYMYKNGRFLEVAIIVAYAFYGISETFLMNCFLNISLLLYGEALYSLSASRIRQQVIVTNGRKNIYDNIY